jgi:hypothetical protein
MMYSGQEAVARQNAAFSDGSTPVVLTTDVDAKLTHLLAKEIQELVREERRRTGEQQ